MNNVFSLYPMLNDDIFSKFRYQTSDYNCFYTKEHEEIELQLESMDEGIKSYKLSDDKGIWNPDEYNWGFRREYSFRTTECLFGKNGIACGNSVIGVAVLWTSSSSKQRGVIEVGEILNDKDSETRMFVEKSFEVAQLRGTLELSTILYIKKPDNIVNIDEMHLANKQGIILGEIDNINILLDGKGSMFPIYEVTEPMQPLWYIKCTWDDPTVDLFSENVSIYINKSHKNYKYLNPDKRTYDEQLIKEIISSSLTIIIMKLKESAYWSQIENGEQLEAGSVSEAVYYFIKTLDFNTQTPELLSLSIRNYFDKKL